MSTVGVAVPSIPPRGEMLQRALRSVYAQEGRQAHAISIAIDVDHEGAPATRNRAWRALSQDYVAFLDDDDEFLPMHLARLLDVAEETDADMVYSWFDQAGNPFPETHFTEPWDPQHPRQTTITCMWKRVALEVVGGFPEIADEAPVDETGNRIGEDYAAVLNLNRWGGKIVHLAERTWLWHQHAGSTCGRATRW